MSSNSYSRTDAVVTRNTHFFFISLLLIISDMLIAFYFSAITSSDFHSFSFNDLTIHLLQVQSHKFPTVLHSPEYSALLRCTGTEAATLYLLINF